MTKIDKATFRKLRKQGKKREEIAEYFKCSVNAVDRFIIRHHAQKMDLSVIRKRRKTQIQTKIFNEVNVHVTTAQGMINELSIAISDNVSIKESIKQKIKEAKSSNVIKEEIDRFFEAQDRVVQRMKDYRELQKDLIGIAELQKFVYAIIEAYGALPLEYRIKFQDELKKRDIIHLSIEQLVESSERNTGSNQDNALPGNVTERDGTLSEATKVAADASSQ
jgi:hypothetical protein